MSEDRVYKCSLTVRIVKKSPKGQTLDVQRVEIPVMGRVDSQYQVSYQVCLPKYYHLARKSPRMIAGKIEVQQGQATLSNDHQTFVYELNAGVLIVRYLNQNYQEVGHGLITKALGTNLQAITRQIPIPGGYHCDQLTDRPVQRFSQSLLVRVEGDSATLRQSALEIIKQEINRQGHAIRQQIHTIHISGRIGDRFSLHPADYRFPHTIPTSKMADINGVITPNGVKPFHAQFVYIKYRQPVLSYPLTIKILKKDQGRIDSHTVIKQIRGKLHHQYHYSYRDFQPRGFQLSASSLRAVRGQITENGLSHPAVAFIFDRIQTVSVKYVNQNHQIVGHSRGRVLDPILNHLKLPQGYVMDADQRRFDRNAGTLIVQVKGKLANQNQNAVHLQIVKRQPNGRLISRQPKVIHISGNIGDHFQIDPAKQCPEGFLNQQNRPVMGRITFNGTQIDHQILTYQKKSVPKGKILLRYVDQHNRIIAQPTFTERIGQPFNHRQIQQLLPAHYRLIKIASGNQVHQFERQPQIIMIQVIKLLTSAERAAHSSASMQKAIQQKEARPVVQKDQNAAVAQSAASQAAKNRKLSSKVASLRALLSMARTQQNRSTISQAVKSRARQAASESANNVLKSKADYLRSLASSVSDSASSASSQRIHSLSSPSARFVQSSAARSSRSSVSQSSSESVNPSSQSTSVKKASDSANQQSKNSSAQNRHVNVVKEAFLYRCYSEIFGTDLLKRWSAKQDDPQQVKMGVILANDYIQGAADALKGQSDSRQHSHSYQYGLKSGAALAKREAHPTIAKILMKIINRSSVVGL